MKKLLLIASGLFITVSVNAQLDPPHQPKTEVSKEEKAKQKEAQDAAIFTAAGLSAEEITQVKAIQDEYKTRDKEMKKTALSDEEKKVKSKEISKERNEKIKALLGEEKYSKWQAEKKKVADLNKEKKD